MKTTQNYCLYKLLTNQDLTKNGGLTVSDLSKLLGIAPVSVPVYLWELKIRGLKIKRAKMTTADGVVRVFSADVDEAIADKIKYRKNAKVPVVKLNAA